MKRLSRWTAFALALTLIGGLVSESDAQRRGHRAQARTLQIDENADGIADGRALRHSGRGGTISAALAAQLSTEQRTVLREEVKALRKTGASAAEISAAIVSQYEGAGIELPEGFSADVSKRIGQRQALAANRQAMRTLVSGLKEEGATREEIAAALAEAGYEVPTMGRRGYRGARGFAPPAAASPSAE